MKKTFFFLIFLMGVTAAAMAKAGDIVDAKSLEIGKTYKFTKEAVMSSMMAPEVLYGQPITDFKLVYPRYSVTVREKVVKDDVFWYHIAVSSGGKVLGDGWVSSTGLSKQQVVELR